MKRFLIILAISVQAQVAFCQLSVAEIFTDNMILQREQPIHIWGWAEPGIKITVTFDKKNYSVTSDQDGTWNAKLPAYDAGGPYEMAVSDGSSTFTYENILMGDIWLCSGQSNMEWTVRNSNDAEKEIADSDHPSIRHYKVSLTYSKTPEDHLEGGPWEVAGQETTGDFSAVGYFFARELQKHENVPIGLLNSSWGGSRIEPWMRSESLVPFLEGNVEDILAKREQDAIKAREKIQAMIGNVAGPAEFDAALKPGFNDASWPDLSVPGLWEQQGFEGMDGVTWIRKEINLSSAEAANDISLHLGMIDDSDQTYVNGKLIGETQSQWNSYRQYTVPSENIHPGTNVILVRIEDTGGGGGVHGSEDSIYYETASGRQNLSGNWKFRVNEVRAGGGGLQANQTPTLLYNKMIHPIIGFPIKGVLWYQGESNANSSDAFVYRDIFKTMITDWRKLWGQGDFPFLWVQLANYMQPDQQPAESNWAVLRESQSAALELPNTGEAVIIDIGEADDIHPRNKQDVGLRLAMAARKVAFGENIVYSGPVFKKAEKRNGEVYLTFEHTGSGLMTKGDKPTGFAIAGEDGKFVWAEALMDGNEIKVWSEQVTNPAYIRYAWGNNPDEANLYNKEGLPARPFRAKVN